MNVRPYLIVFATLMVLTGVTVGLSRLHWPLHLAVAVALLVATTKAALVALFFMHLKTEKRIVYGVLALTAVCLLFVLSIGFY